MHYADCSGKQHATHYFEPAAILFNAAFSQLRDRGLRVAGEDASLWCVELSLQSRPDAIYDAGDMLCDTANNYNKQTY